MSDFRTWVKESELAAAIPVPMRIIIKEEDLSKADILSAADKPLSLDKETLKKKAPFALEVGGQIVGWGRIEKRFGSHYFKLIETVEETREEDK